MIIYHLDKLGVKLNTNHLVIKHFFRFVNFYLIKQMRIRTTIGTTNILVRIGTSTTPGDTNKKKELN